MLLEGGRMNSHSSPVHFHRFPARPVLGLLVAAVLIGCAAGSPSARGGPAGPTAPGETAERPLLEGIDPVKATAAADKAPGLLVLEKELGRAMKALSEVKPAAYFISYEAHDRAEVSITASNG